MIFKINEGLNEYVQIQRKSKNVLSNIETNIRLSVLFAIKSDEPFTYKVLTE